MRHVTDGEIHAYLDGSLELLGGARGKEVREHLASCRACAERLQDEERIRNRARDLLRGPSLDGLELPSLEAMRLQAEAASPGGKARDGEAPLLARRKGLLRGVPLAWAATVVLALGVGWMGGEIWRSLPAGVSPGLQSAEPQGVAETGASLEGAAERTPLEVEEAVQPAMESKAGEARESAAPPAVGGGEASRPGQADELAAVEGARGGEPPTGAQVGVAGRGGAPGEGERAGGGLAVPAERLRGGDRGELLRAAREDPAAELDLAPAMIGAVGAPPPDSLGASLAVPGLKVLSMEWEEWVPGERALRIRQLLSVGDTLELRYLGMLVGQDPEHRVAGDEPVAGERPKVVERPLTPDVLKASLPPGWNQVVMTWGHGWLVARAPLDVPSLKALLRTIR